MLFINFDSIFRMQRSEARFTVIDSNQFKNNLLNWSKKHSTAIWLDSNNHHQKYSSYEAALAVGASKKIVCTSENAFEKLKQFQQKTKDYLFGYLSYDLKNDIENLESTNFDGLQFPDLQFFQPEKLIFIVGNSITFKYLKNVSSEIESDFKEINSEWISDAALPSKNINIQFRIKEKEYLKKVTQVLKHIHRGDIYEANFCMELFSENSSLDPLETFKKLNEISKPPFATFLKIDDHFLLSATPERYLKKTGTKIISQPIKGTAKRSNSKTEDQILKENLANDPKEKAENVMIVDLVRNDLTHFAQKGSVKVEELCAIYSFKQVHQMISTITAEVSSTINPVDIIKKSYPMGSMTGAPKIAAMQIIETLEETKRGLYSGAVGYFTPQGDFDFNVIIRSILYNKKNKYISFSVGSAITALSDPKKELEECLLKAKAMQEVLLCTK